jgi:hypothetical protein
MAIFIPAAIAVASVLSVRRLAWILRAEWDDDAANNRGTIARRSGAPRRRRGSLQSVARARS